MLPTGVNHSLTRFALERALDAYLASLAGSNKSPQTIRAYQTDLNQFIAYLRQTDATITVPRTSRAPA